jgi:hypothetical protein
VPIGYPILPVTPILPAIQPRALPSGPSSTTRNIHTERGRLNAVDPAYPVDLGPNSSPDQPPKPYPPHYLARLMSRGTLLPHQPLR